MGSAMDFATRLKALARLAQSSSTGAEQMLASEQSRAQRSLRDEVDYDLLVEALEVLAVVGFRASAEAAHGLDEFIRTVEIRQLKYSAAYAGLLSQIQTYRNAQTLICKAIDVLAGLRYLQTTIVTRSLLWGSAHPSETVRRSATSALKKLALYDMDVFVGNDSRRGIGARPQMEIVETLEGMGDVSVLEHLEGTLAIVSALLSTSMERAVWSSQQVTLYRGTTPASHDVAAVRVKCIDLLGRLYRLATSPASKRSIISAMTAATRPDRAAVADPIYAAMISENTRAVLEFFREAIASADLQTIQKVEHSSYWIYQHSVQADVRQAALAVKAAIEANDEYTIFKTLVGFEGIFGDWDNPDRSQFRGEASLEARSERATEYVNEITPESSEKWRRRVLSFAATESNDLATFPVFFQFLEALARAHPALGLKLITDDIGVMANFAIPLLRGLWDGEARDRAREVINSWIGAPTVQDHQLLRASAKLFLSAKDVDFDALEAILSKAIECKAKDVIEQITAVAVGRYSAGVNASRLKELFLHCIRVLTELKDASWVQSVWYHQEAKGLVSDLDVAERATVLDNLRYLPSVDYQAEEILTQIARVAPSEVIRFFCLRAEDEAREEITPPFGEFEAIPFDFHNLQEPLSTHARDAVAIVYENYRSNPSIFEFRGGKLLQGIFPKFAETFKRELHRLLDEGGDESLEFVVSVLRAYDGEAFLYPICKAVVEHLPQEHPLLQSVSAVLLSTGVVMGEFGLAEAYEKKLIALSSWLNDESEAVRAYARSFVEGLKSMIEQERQRAEELILLRKFRFGEA